MKDEESTENRSWHPIHPPERQCGALKRQGGHCTQRAGWGTPHPGIGTCKLHGGCAPSAVRKAKREMARRAVKTFGLPVEVEPHQALLDELYRTAGHVAWLSEQVRQLEEDDLHGPVGSRGVNDQGVQSYPREEAHIWVRLYQEERAHVVKVAKVCIDVGIEELRVRIAEKEGQLLADVIRGVLVALGIDPVSRRAREVVREQLMAVAGSGTGRLQPRAVPQIDPST